MLRLLIIDDEPSIRAGLRIILDWQSLGIGICGEAVNGIDGLAKVSELMPDIAIVDIKMPGVDGLELIGRLHRAGSGIRFIILSGYSEFAYAQKAIHYGVDSYILKPIDAGELAEKVATARDAILLERQRNARFLDSVALSRDRMLERLVGLKKADDESQKKCNDLYDLGFPWFRYQVALLTPGGCAGQDAGAVERIAQAADECLRKNRRGTAFVMAGQAAALVRNTANIPDQPFLEALRVHVSNESGCLVTVAAGSVERDIGFLHRSYASALDLQRRRFLFGDGKTLIAEQSSAVSSSQSRGEEQDGDAVAEKLYVAVDASNTELIAGLLDQVKCGFAGSFLTEYEIKTRYMNLWNAIAGRVAAANDGCQHLIGEAGAVLPEIGRQKDLQELHSFMRRRLVSLSNELARQRPEGVIKRVLDYIGRNFDKDIRLETLAEVFNYSSTYLGKLFKNSTGEYFNTYLDRIRMDKACRLLQGDEKINSIAAMVGFDSLSYFYSKFKKHTGMSPAAYKKLHRSC